MIPALLAARLTNQRLAGPKFETPLEAVAHLGAVQSQDYSGAKWALAQRLSGATSTSLDAAFNAGEILRTHVLRPTWHFVAPADIRWLLELSHHRVLTVAGYEYRKLGLTTNTFTRADAILTEALSGNNFLTRAECEQLFSSAGISLAAPPGVGAVSTHLMMHAELTGLITSGPLRGKQQTYALLADRAPQSQTLPRELALAELARRYFTSHGPATAKDFAWWSGLTLADVGQAVKTAGGDLLEVSIDGRDYWTGPNESAPETRSRAYLLPNYDEYTVSYADRTALIPADIPAYKLDGRANPLFNNAIILNGRVAGTWRRTLKSSQIDLEITPFAELSAAETNAVRAAANDYARFAGQTVAMIAL